MLTILGAIVIPVGCAILAAWVAMRVRHPPAGKPRVVDVSVSGPTDAAKAGAQHNIIDVRLVNDGGRPVVLTAATLHIVNAVQAPSWAGVPLWRFTTPVARGTFEPSATYSRVLPTPDRAAAAQVVVYISHLIRAGEGERIQLDLQVEEGIRHVVYIIDVELGCGPDEPPVQCPRTAAGFGVTEIPDPARVESSIDRFLRSVRETRAEIDRELVMRALPTPNWNEVTARRDLPDNVALPGIDVPPSTDPFDLRDTVLDSFWSPMSAATQHLDTFETDARDYLARIDGIHYLQPSVEQHRQTLAAALDALPIIRERLALRASDFRR